MCVELAESTYLPLAHMMVAMVGNLIHTPVALGIEAWGTNTFSSPQYMLRAPLEILGPLYQAEFTMWSRTIIAHRKDVEPHEL